MEGDLIVADWQQEYNGLLLGAGTPFELQSFKGLGSLPPVRSNSVPRFGSDGGTRSRHNLEGRELIGIWDILGATSDDDFRSYRDQLALAFAMINDPDDVKPFVYQIPGRTKLRVYCRPIARNTDWDLDFAARYGMSAVRLEAADPYIYANTERSLTLVAGTFSGGLDFPLTFPLHFGTAAGGSGNAYNGGTSPAPWVVTITGETPGPKIILGETGESLDLSTLTIATGDTLVIDSKDRTILYNGTSSRRGLLTPASRWFFLNPGSNTVQFTPSGVSTGNMTITWRDTYWSD